MSTVAWHKHMDTPGRTCQACDEPATYNRGVGRNLCTRCSIKIHRGQLTVDEIDARSRAQRAAS